MPVNPIALRTMKSLVRRSVILVLVFLPVNLFAQETISLQSPDGNIRFTLNLNKEGPVYSVAYKKSTLIENSAISMDLAERGTFTKTIFSKPSVFTEVNNTYPLVVGKTSLAKNH
jgi:alpha-glucosidase